MKRENCTFLTFICLPILLICFGKTESLAAVDTNEGRKPIEVRVSIQIDQITDVNQKAENFSIVGNFMMIWQDSRFAFDSAVGEEKVFSSSQFENFAHEKELTWPRFLFNNQQDKRWIQEELFVVRPKGEVTYLERFSVTLQAPDFNFHKYPFDIQKFDIHILSLHQDKDYIFVVDSDHNEMGINLGEDEWIIGPYSTFVDSIKEIRGTHSHFTYSFTAKRHLDYYFFRIFLPLLLIVSVAYATFFMRDYSKRVDYSAANLLTFVMFNFAVGSDLPRLGYLTFIDSILVLAFVVTAVTVITNVIIKRLDITGKKTVAKRWDRTILWGYPILYVGGLGLIYYIYLS
jgi:Neurotransmitter-gated ion-channel ligand binding domain